MRASKRRRRTTDHRRAASWTPPKGLTLVLLGPQGAGKGTQGSLLAQRYGFVHLETGGMLRHLASSKPSTPFSRRIDRLLRTGALVPFSLVLKLFALKISALPRSRGIVIDGTPRRLAEAKQLVTMLRKRFHREIAIVFCLTISRRETFRRLASRWVCTRCRHSLIMGKDVHAPNDPCTRCGGVISQRSDDRPAAIAKRLALYRRETQPVIDYFRGQRLLVEVDGEATIPVVFRAVDRAFRKHFLHAAKHS